MQKLLSVILLSKIVIVGELAGQSCIESIIDIDIIDDNWTTLICRNKVQISRSE